MKNKTSALARAVVVLMFLLTFFSVPITYGQSTKNAIINFDFSFSDGEFLEFWKVGVTDTFQFIGADGNVHKVQTIDTIVTYAVKQLEEFHKIEIAPVKLGTVKLNMLGKLTGFPHMRVTDAARSGEYAQMFDISAWAFGTSSFRLGLPVEGKKDKVNMTIKIKQYDSSAKMIASYKKRTNMAELSKTTLAVLGFMTTKYLTGNELFALFAIALQNALVDGEKKSPG